MIVAPLTPKTNASRVLTDLGLRRGQGRDFMITGGEPRITGGQTHIVVVMWNDRASRIVDIADQVGRTDVRDPFGVDRRRRPATPSGTAGRGGS